MPFENPEDKKYFIDLLADGNKDLFEKKFLHFFDFRDNEIKRREFNSLKKSIEKKLKKKSEKCCLQIPGKCTADQKMEIDHIIPLTSNKLNKELRNLKPEPGKKVKSQSFGSNHIDNLIYACHSCNAFKKHKILDKKSIKRVLGYNKF